jgi:hypothetical protein
MIAAIFLLAILALLGIFVTVTTAGDDQDQ